MKESVILDRLIFVGGPPRSGTTLAVQSLNQHPQIVAAINDHVYENWGLYYYGNRTGLVQDIRAGHAHPDQVRQNLSGWLFADQHLIGAAPSEKTLNQNQVTRITTQYAPTIRAQSYSELGTYAFPLEQFSPDWRLCLKSPEITFVLPELAQAFPHSFFVLVYRPAYEIAESMHRIGHMVKQFPVFHQRWALERDISGYFIPPPGVPAEWHGLWQTASAFKRCVIYAASYLRALLAGLQLLPAERYFLYNHAALRLAPDLTFFAMAESLGLDAAGFFEAEEKINSESPLLATTLAEEYTTIETHLNLQALMQKIQAYLTHPH